MGCLLVSFEGLRNLSDFIAALLVQRLVSGGRNCKKFELPRHSFTPRVPQIPLQRRTPHVYGNTTATARSTPRPKTQQRSVKDREVHDTRTSRRATPKSLFVVTPSCPAELNLSPKQPPPTHTWEPAVCLPSVCLPGCYNVYPFVHVPDGFVAAKDGNESLGVCCSSCRKKTTRKEAETGAVLSSALLCFFVAAFVLEGKSRTPTDDLKPLNLKRTSLLCSLSRELRNNGTCEAVGRPE